MYNGIVEKCRGPSGQPDGSSFYGGMPMKNPFSGLFRARDKPQDSVSAAPVFYFGTSGSGKLKASRSIKVHGYGVVRGTRKHSCRGLAF